MKRLCGFEMFWVGGKMDFSNALDALKKGKKVSRAGWNGKGLSVQIQRPDANSKMSLPYLFIEYPNGQRCPWHASQTDILAEDWNVIPEFKLDQPNGKKPLYAYKHQRGHTVYLEHIHGSNQYMARYPSDDVTVS